MNTITFKVLNNSAMLTDNEMIEEILRIETVMNENSILRFHLIENKDELGHSIEVLKNFITKLFN